MIVDVLSERGRFAPLAADHPSVGSPCVGCGEPLRVGERPAMVNGVPDGPIEQYKAVQNRPHRVECQLAHESCAFASRVAPTGQETNDG